MSKKKKIRIVTEDEEFPEEETTESEDSGTE